MELIKVDSFTAVLDGIAARLNGRTFDVLSVDWQMVDKTRSVLVLRGSNSDREVRIRFVMNIGNASKVEMAMYDLGVKPDTCTWEFAQANRIHAIDIIQALSPTL